MKTMLGVPETKPVGPRRVYNATRGMSIEQEVAFWKRQVPVMRREVAEKHRIRTINK